MANQPVELKFVVTKTLIVGDIKRSVAFYRDVLGATVLREGEPTFLRLANLWITINGGGGGTDDKPEVIAAPPRDPNLLNNFLTFALRTSGAATRFGLRAERNSSLSPRCTRQKSAATCATQTATLLKWDKRP